MPINSRTKGAAFERLIVRKINACLQQQGLEDRVSRNFDQSWKAGLADIYLETLLSSAKDMAKAIPICIGRNGGIRLLKVLVTTLYQYLYINLIARLRCVYCQHG